MFIDFSIWFLVYTCVHSKDSVSKFKMLHAINLWTVAQHKWTEILKKYYMLTSLSIFRVKKTKVLVVSDLWPDYKLSENKLSHLFAIFFFFCLLCYPPWLIDPSQHMSNFDPPWLIDLSEHMFNFDPPDLVYTH
jgi:hypothetical protein